MPIALKALRQLWDAIHDNDGTEEDRCQLQDALIYATQTINAYGSMIDLIEGPTIRKIWTADVRRVPEPESITTHGVVRAMVYRQTDDIDGAERFSVVLSMQPKGNGPFYPWAGSFPVRALADLEALVAHLRLTLHDLPAP